MRYLFLTHFHPLFGPRVFINFPEESSCNTIFDKIQNFFDLKEEFFEIKLIEESLKAINLAFEIPSAWARGRKEMVMLSIITDKNFKNNFFIDILIETKEMINSISEIYKAFYLNEKEHEDDDEINKKYDILKKLISETLQKIENQINTSAIGNILILGLNKVGKSSIIEWLKKRTFYNVKPTLALTLIEQIIDSYLFKIIDVSGQKKLRNQWWSYTKHPDAIVYIVDMEDIIENEERLIENKEEIKTILEKYSSKGKEDKINKKTPLIFCVNKIDLRPDSEMTKEKIAKILGLEDFNRKYSIQFTSALTGEGIEKSFKWLVTKLLKIS